MFHVRNDQVAMTYENSKSDANSKLPTADENYPLIFTKPINVVINIEWLQSSCFQQQTKLYSQQITILGLISIFRAKMHVLNCKTLDWKTLLSKYVDEWKSSI
jgi:hypothetical protein